MTVCVCVCVFPWVIYTYPKNHGISKLVVWRSQNPAIQIQTPLFLEGPMILRDMYKWFCDSEALWSGSKSQILASLLIQKKTEHKIRFHREHLQQLMNSFVSFKGFHFIVDLFPMSFDQTKQKTLKAPIFQLRMFFNYLSALHSVAKWIERSGGIKLHTTRCAKHIPFFSFGIGMESPTKIAHHGVTSLFWFKFGELATSTTIEFLEVSCLGLFWLSCGQCWFSLQNKWSIYSINTVKPWCPTPTKPSFFKVIANPPEGHLWVQTRSHWRTWCMSIYRYTVDILQCSLIYQQTTLTSPLKEFHSLSQLHPASFTSFLFQVWNHHFEQGQWLQVSS